MQQLWYKLSATMYFHGNFKSLMNLASFYFLSSLIHSRRMSYEKEMEQ